MIEDDDRPERLEVWAPGLPAAKGSMRHIGKGRMIHTSKKLPAWVEAVETALTDAAGDDFPAFQPPVGLSVHFHLPKPRTSRYAGPYGRGTGDLDKHVRSVGDCLQNAGIIVDDSHITRITASKRWTVADPGARITIEHLAEEMP